MQSMSKKIFDIIDQQSYEMGYAAGLVDGIDSAYEQGYFDCAIDTKKDAKRRKQLRKMKKLFKLYYILQKLLGVLILLVMVAMAKVLDGDMTIYLLMLPLSLALIFSRKPLIVKFKPEVKYEKG